MESKAALVPKNLQILNPPSTAPTSQRDPITSITIQFFAQYFDKLGMQIRLLRGAKSIHIPKFKPPPLDLNLLSTSYPWIISWHFNGETRRISLITYSLLLILGSSFGVPMGKQGGS